MSKLNVKALALGLGVVGVIFYLVCLLWMYVTPVELQELHKNLLEMSLPGFKWLTVGSFIVGLVESFVYCFVTGALIGYFHNLFAKK